VRRAAAVAAVLAGGLLAGCHGGAPQPSPAASGIGGQVKAMEMDINTMREANAAADDVIRAAGDCDRARPLIAAANARLDEVQKKIQTATAQTTLEALRKKVREVSESCP
jgi:outer membrane murein-binding lipoprotein Lpp